MKFLNEGHRIMYSRYFHKAGVGHGDRERQALFYILSGNHDLISKGIDNCYDFDRNIIKFSSDSLEEELKKFSFCISSEALIRLALNLYNSEYKSLSISDTFYNLDENNKILALEGIKIRFNIK